MFPDFQPHPLLSNGFSMTLFAAWQGKHLWQRTGSQPDPPYRGHTFSGAGGVPIFGTIALPERPKATLIATYGITGELSNQWFLRLLGQKAFAQNYAVVLFDWRAHGQTARLSPTLTSDGLYEGEDFVRIAARCKQLGCPSPFWLAGFSLGGQLALWGIQAAQTVESWGPELDLQASEIGGGAALCPNLDSNRSLSYLVNHPLGKYVERAIAKELKRLAWKIHRVHPQAISPDAIARANTIAGFDRELVIGNLGFSSVEEYYQASSPLPLLPQLRKPTLIVYAADDPLFDPSLPSDLQAACSGNSAIDLLLTPKGGHVGYLSSPSGQRQAGDPDPWWAWNRVLDWCNFHSSPPSTQD